MTRKDYIVLAEALRSTKPSVTSSWQHDEQWELDVVAIAEALKRDNPRMNYDKFFTACKGE